MTDDLSDAEAPVLPGRVRVPGRGQVILASISLRAVARVIDSFVIASIALACWVVGARLALRSADTVDGDLGAAGEQTLVLALALAVVLIVLYDIALVALFGATLGKRVVGTRVVSASDGGRPGWWRALRRWALTAAGNLVCGLGVVVYLSALMDRKRRQGWHDMVADTLVVMRR